MTALDNKIQEIVIKIMDEIYLLREVSKEQYRESSSLPISQQIWLCESKSEERGKNDFWLENILLDCIRWIFNSYSKSLGDKQFMLGNSEFNDFKSRIEEWIAENKEFLL